MSMYPYDLSVGDLVTITVRQEDYTHEHFAERDYSRDLIFNNTIGKITYFDPDDELWIYRVEMDSLEEWFMRVSLELVFSK